MKKILAFLVLILALHLAGASDDGSGEIEAITILSLPVDSVTIYPDGLATVKRLVEAHGGRVGVRTTPGGGTTFTVELPYAMEKG